MDTDGSVDFEWDDAKADLNLRKHRLTFEDALLAFADPALVLIDTVRAQDGEARRKAVGLIHDRLFTVVIIMRGGTCRLISARRANGKEEQTYESR